MTLELPPMQPGFDWNTRIHEDLVVTNAEEPRNYLGMSGIGYCPYKLWNGLANHPAMDPEEALRMAQYHESGYMHEAKVKWRLERMGLYVPGSEWEVVAPFTSAGGVLFKGHTDGATKDGDLLEVKSVSCRRFQTMRSYGPFVEHLCQANSYMRYGPWTKVVFVYVNRCSYQWLVLVEEKDEALGLEMEEKAKAILAALDSGAPPDCTCGKCY